MTDATQGPTQDPTKGPTEALSALGRAVERPRLGLEAPVDVES
jgi:hypothetical protein